MPAESKSRGRRAPSALAESNLDDIKEELRVISMEYADIRSRIEATDILMDHLIHQLDSETRMRRVTTLLIAVLLAVTVALLLSLPMGF